MDGETEGVVYLLHYDGKLHHASHYLGWTNNLPQRLRQHRFGPKERCAFTFAMKQNGFDFVVAKTWKGPISKEKELKRRKNNSKLCPICNS